MIGNSSAFNSQNPFLIGTEPAYHSLQYMGNIGGPLGKKASFFFDVQRRNIDEVAIINATILNPGAIRIAVRCQLCGNALHRCGSAAAYSHKHQPAPRLPDFKEQHSDRALSVFPQYGREQRSRRLCVAGPGCQQY